MKRFFVSLALVLLVVWAVRSNHRRPERPAPPPVRWHGPRPPHDGGVGRDLASEARRQTREVLAETGRAIDEARHEVRQAYREARGEIRQVWHEVSDEVRQAYHEAITRDSGQPPAPPQPPTVPAREEADGLPVPIVPGTRVTEAEAKPPVPPRGLVTVRHGQAPRAAMPMPPAAMPMPPAAIRTTMVKGQISATQERAEADARAALRDQAADWLEPEVPRTWTIPMPLLQSLIVDTHYTPDEKPYGTLYWAELKVNFSPERRVTLVEAYNRELIQHRLASLGGALAFVLIGLGAVSGYIRADEATKGYYTNRLRMLAAAGVGAAGVILYRMVA
jgi:hypothetical protein